MAGIESAVPFATNLLPQYQSPQQMAVQNAQANALQANANYTAGPQSYLTQQQGSAADLANQITSMKLPAIQAGIQKYLDYNKNLNTPTNQGSQPLTGNNLATADDVERAAAQNYMPMPTTPEMVQADAGATIAGLPPTAVASNEARNAQRATAANAETIASNSVATATVGNRLATLARFEGQGVADAYRAAHPGLSEAQLDADAGTHFAAAAAAAHQWSGRGIDITSAGVVLDHPTGQPVLGTDQISNISKKDLVEIKQKGETIVDAMVNGVPAKLPLWQADGASSEAVWDAEQVRTFRNQNRQNDAKPQTATGQVGGGQPTNTSPQAPSSAAPGASTALNNNLIAELKNGGNPVPMAGPKAPPSAPPPPGVPNGLPGVDPTGVTQVDKSIYAVPLGQSATPAQKGTQDRVNTEITSQLQLASQASANDARQRSLLVAANKDLSSVDPKTVGAGGKAYNTWLDLKKIVSGGEAPDAQVNQEVLDKFLAQIGAGNVRTLLTGQTITNEEMMTFMTHGSPNVDQPVQTIQRLLQYLGADNDYDSRLQQTKIAALHKGADPFALAGDLENASPRTDWIQRMTGTNLSGPQSRAAAAQPDSGGFVPGKAYKDANGNIGTYIGNGKWQ